MADQVEQASQVSAGKNLQAAQAVAVAQPPSPLRPQNQEEPANPNSGLNTAREEVTLEVCLAFCFLVSRTCSWILYFRCLLKFVFGLCFAMLQTFSF